MRTLLRAVSSVLVLVFAIAAHAANDDAKAILIKAIKAHGGAEAQEKYKATQAKNKGKLKLPGLGDVEFTQSLSVMQPNKFKEVLEFEVANQKVSVVTTANGDKYSIEANGKAIDITDGIKKALKDAQHLMKASQYLNLLKDKSLELTPLGEVKVEGKSCEGVRVASKGYQDVNLYFNKETGLLAKIETRSTDPMTEKEYTDERIFLEYGPKGPEGMPIPKKVLVKHDGEKFLEAEVVELKFLEKLDDSEFGK
jgi:hypothetical protein